MGSQRSFLNMYSKLFQSVFHNLSGTKLPLKQQKYRKLSFILLFINMNSLWNGKG